MTAPVRIDPTTVRVALDARSYDIVIGRGLLASLGARIAALRPGVKAVIVSDLHISVIYTSKICTSKISKIESPPGRTKMQRTKTRTI